MFKLIMSTLMLFAFQSSLNAGTTPTLENTTKLYVATFNRAPDAVGLDYWANGSGLDLEGIAQSFFDQPETKEAYPADSNNADFIEAVYLNLFNRASDQAGLDYWIEELNSGRIAKSIFILAVINGAQNTEEFGNDAIILTNKTTVGLAFANAGLNDVEFAEEIMNDITDDESTVTIALQIIEDRNALIHHVTNLQDLRRALNDATLNGVDDVIQLSAGSYNIADDGRGSLSMDDEEPFNLTLRAEPGLSRQDVILKANETGRVLTYNNTQSSTLRLEGISVTDGNSKNGAGIFSTSDVVLKDCDISHNNGIGLYTNGKVTIDNSSINDNNGTGFVANGTTTVVTNTTVARNLNSGFAAYGSVSVNNSKIIDNYSHGYYSSMKGGGFYSAGDVNVIDSNVSGNYMYGSGSRGGGFYTGGYAIVINSIFANNELRARTFEASGGGFFVNKEVEIKDCEFTRNIISSVSGANRGGGFTAVRASVKNTTFSDNIAKEERGSARGGGFNVLYPSTVINSKFINNSASTAGGGFYVVPDITRGGGSIVNTVFINNSAAYGSAVYAKFNPFNVINSQFIGNINAPAIKSYGVFINNIFDQNDIDLEIMDDSTIYNTYIDITQITTEAGITVSKKNLLDPYYDGEIFLDDDNIRLTAYSPVIDKGLNPDSSTFSNLIEDEYTYDFIKNVLLVDLLGNKRIYNGTIDMGVAEYGSHK